MLQRIKTACCRALARLLRSILKHTDLPDRMMRLEAQVKTLKERSKENLLRSSRREKAARKELQDLKRLAVKSDVWGRMAALEGGHRGSVVFVENNYYHFYYLARALRKRGWDARVVSFSDPSGPWAKYQHGCDINLYDADPEIESMRRESFFEAALDRFKLAHFCSDFSLSFFSHDHDKPDPPDLQKWIARGNFVACTLMGCNSCVSKESVHRWSMLGGNSACSCCAWNERPDMCHPKTTLMNGERAVKYCAFIAGELSPALDYLTHPKAILELPLTGCLDPDVWHPGLAVPDEFKLERLPGEVLIFHGVGEYESRTKNGVNLKGTRAVVEAVERLKTEGHVARLVFASGMRNLDVRFLQSQCDIVVDQLNYGRYGSQAREGMMLGKPVICYINKHEMNGIPTLRILDQCPLQSATEKTVYEVLKDLVLNRAKRETIGARSRAYVVQWHSPDACAERYEKVYDAMLAGEWNMRDFFRDVLGRNDAGADGSSPLPAHEDSCSGGAPPWEPARERIQSANAG